MTLSPIQNDVLRALAYESGEISRTTMKTIAERHGLKHWLLVADVEGQLEGLGAIVRHADRPREITDEGRRILAARKPVEIGDHVQAGTGEDHDTGRVTSIGDGLAMVAWHSGVETPCPLDELRPAD